MRNENAYRKVDQSKLDYPQTVFNFEVVDGYYIEFVITETFYSYDVRNDTKWKNKDNNNTIGPFHYPIKKLMPELRLHCHANSAGYWSVRRAHANRTECHGKTSGLQPTPQHTTVMHGTIRPQTPFRVPPLWRTPLVSCGHRTCRLPTSTTQACRCAAITHGGEARGP